MPLGEWHQTLKMICVRSQNCDCPIAWFCYQLIAKPGDKTATVPWPDPYVYIEPMLTQFCEAIWHHYYIGRNENRIFFLISKHMWQCIMGWHIKTWTKRLPFCRKKNWNAISSKKSYEFWSKFQLRLLLEVLLKICQQCWLWLVTIQAPSHYQIQFWPKSTTAYSITRTQKD